MITMKTIQSLKTKQYRISMLFLGMLACWFLPNNSWASTSVLATGSCGDNLTYTIYSDMTMVISGTGEMWGYTNNGNFGLHINDDYYQSIEKVIIEDGVTRIGGSAFRGCTSLTSIDIPNSVTSFGVFAFEDCTSLASIEIPNSVTDLSITHTFCGCSSLTSITIPNRVGYIGMGLFSSCTSLTFVEIPNSVTSIWEGAFRNCTSLTSIEIPNSVTSIERYAFSGCTSLTSLTIPSSLTDIDYRAFSCCSGLTSIIVDSENTKYDSRDNCNAIIETATNTLMRGCNTTVIPNNVTEIGDYAFYGCTGLTSVIIPGCVTAIGYEAFCDCMDLTSVVIPNSVTTIGSSSFYNCTSLTSVKIPNSITEISDYVFYDCSSLTSITCESETPVAISSNVFGNVPKSICTLCVPFGCKSAYENADGWNEFENIVEAPEILATGPCGDNLTYTIYADMSMVISGTGEMWDYMEIFSNANSHINDDHYQSIEKVIIEDGVTNIGNGAFKDFTSLTSIDIPNSVTSFGVNAFKGCTGLVSIDIPNSVTELGVTGTFGGCSSLTSITIPYGVGYIGMGAFSSCTSLTSIEIPNSVYRIAEGAFRGCTGLTSFTIPNSVAFIDECAFQNCTGLTSITCESESPVEISSNRFAYVDKSACTLYVPFGSKSAYESAVGWSEFENIVEYGGEPDTDISALDNVIYVEQTNGCIGGTMDISVKLKNSYAVRGFQFNLELPEGTTINSWRLSSNRLPTGATANDKMSSQNSIGNKINLACTLNYGAATFTGNDGEIATINVTFDEDMEVGSYPIYLTACDISNASNQDEDLNDIKATLILDDYLVGDTNSDGKVRIGDVSSILNYLVNIVSDNFNLKAADANGDGKIRIGDASTVLNIIVNQ